MSDRRPFPPRGSRPGVRRSSRAPAGTSSVSRVLTLGMTASPVFQVPCAQDAPPPPRRRKDAPPSFLESDQDAFYNEFTRLFRSPSHSPPLSFKGQVKTSTRVGNIQYFQNPTQPLTISRQVLPQQPGRRWSLDSPVVRTFVGDGTETIFLPRTPRSPRDGGSCQVNFMVHGANKQPQIETPIPPPGAQEEQLNALKRRVETLEKLKTPRSPRVNGISHVQSRVNQKGEPITKAAIPAGLAPAMIHSCVPSKAEQRPPVQTSLPSCCTSWQRLLPFNVASPRELRGSITGSMLLSQQIEMKNHQWKMDIPSLRDVLMSPGYRAHAQRTPAPRITTMNPCITAVNY